MAIVAERRIMFPHAAMGNIKECIDTFGLNFSVNSAERLLSRAPTEFIPGGESSYINAMSEGYGRILIPGHLAHLDALKASMVAEDLDELEQTSGVENPTRGSLLTLAKSVESGHQGPLLSKGFAMMRPIFERHGTIPVPFVREDDIKKYGFDKSVNAESTATLQDGIRDGRGIIMFPEGSVQAGRRQPREPYEPSGNPLRDKENELLITLKDMGLIEEPVNGLQPFNGRQLRTMDVFMRRKGKRAAFVPVKIDGVHRLLRPSDTIDIDNRALRNGPEQQDEGTTIFEDKNVVTMRGKAASVASLFVPTNVGDVHVLVGRTVTMDEAEDTLGKGYTDEAFGDFLGRHVAHLYPEELQGVYRGRTLA